MSFLKKTPIISREINFMHTVNFKFGGLNSANTREDGSRDMFDVISLSCSKINLDGKLSHPNLSVTLKEFILELIIEEVLPLVLLRR